MLEYVFVFSFFFVDVWLGRIDCYLPALTHSLLSSRSFWGFLLPLVRNPSAHAFCIDDSFLAHFFPFLLDNPVTFRCLVPLHQTRSDNRLFVFIGWSAPLLAIFVFQLFKFVFGIPFKNSLFPSPLLWWRYACEAARVILLAMRMKWAGRGKTLECTRFIPLNRK